MNALDIRDLTKHYGDFTLDHLNLSLPSGCIMGLVGENGAGKSTTMRLILENTKRDAGSIRILGKEDGADMRLLKEDIGVVPDEIGLPECLNTAQVGRIMRATFQNWQEGAYEKLLKRLDVPINKPFKAFSRGMKMKLGIAIALSHDAKLLLLDEATSGLDPMVRDDVIELLLDFTRDEGHAVLISSHIVSDLEKLCDYIAFLHKGKLLLCEEKDRLLETYGLVRGTMAQLEAIRPDAVVGVRQSPYGAEALVRREGVPAGVHVGSVSIEDVFVWMAKEGKDA